MSDGFGSGFGNAAGAAGGAVIGTVVGNAMLRRRQRRLAREAARYLGPGEKLAAPIPYGYQGGRRVQAAGVAIFALAIVAGMICAAATNNGGLVSAVLFGGMGAGVLVMLVATALMKNYAIVLTSRRLLLFRTKGRMRQRLREIQIDVPRGQVAMQAQLRIDGAAVSLSFAPATGIAPILLNGGSPGVCVRAVQDALPEWLTPATSSTPPDAATTDHRERGAA